MVKIIKVLIVFLYFTGTVHSQTGVLFSPNGSRWSQEATFWYTSGPGQGPECVCTYSHEIIQNDTVINNKKIQKMYHSTTKDFDTTCLNFLWYLYYDSMKVYVGKKIDSLDLIYDFTLQEGDSFLFKAIKNTPNPNNYTLKVDSVDSVFIGNIYRKRISFKSFPFYGSQKPIVWVEGIGDITYGWVLDYGFIVYANYVNSGNCALLCFTDHSQVSIGNCITGSCNTSIERNELLEEYKVYPNPSKGIIFIDRSSLKTRWRIFDIYGKLITGGILSEQKQIDIKQLSSGIYILMIEENDRHFSKKIIIN